MGSMLLAVVPSKSSKNTSRIPNPFPRLAISAPTPSVCGPIHKQGGGGNGDSQSRKEPKKKKKKRKKKKPQQCRSRLIGGGSQTAWIQNGMKPHWVQGPDHETRSRTCGANLFNPRAWISPKKNPQQGRFVCASAIVTVSVPAT